MTNVFPEIGTTDDPLKSLHEVISFGFLRGTNIRYIAETLARYFDVPRADILSQTRKQPVALARQILCYLASHKYGYSASEIGRQIQRDHSTVLYGIKKINDVVEGNGPACILNIVRNIEKMISEDRRIADEIFRGAA